MKGDVQRAVVAIADTVDNANALITDVSDDVKKMAAAGARITGDAAQIAEGIRSGKGTIGKLVNDDELYHRADGDREAGRRDRVQRPPGGRAGAGKPSTTSRSKDGPVQGMTASVKQTMDGARLAMAALPRTWRR